MILLLLAPCVAMAQTSVSFTLIIAIITSFKFSTLDLQFHDTYYVLDSFDAIKLLTFIFGFGRYFYLLTDIMTERYAILTLLISIVNAIAGLFVLIGAYFSIETIVTFRKMHPGIDFSAHFFTTRYFCRTIDCADNCRD